MDFYAREVERIDNPRRASLEPSAVPAIWCDSVKFEFNSDLSGSLIKQWCEGTALPNSPGVSSGSVVKCAHGESIVTDEEEQPGDTGPEFSSDCRSTRCGCCGR